jgi:hypothetical protein
VEIRSGWKVEFWRCSVGIGSVVFTEGCQGEIGFSKIQLFFLIRVYLLSKPTKINDFWIFGHIWLIKNSIL